MRNVPHCEVPRSQVWRNVNDALFLHRIHFAFTMTFHYLFPQLTIGLAPLIVVLKDPRDPAGNETYNESRASDEDFRINFALGVVTGIPMEFQFAPIGAVLAPYRRRHRPAAGHGRHFFFLPGVGIPGCFCTAKNAWGNGGTGGLASWCSSGHGSQGSLSSSPTHGLQHPVAYTRLSNGGSVFQLLGLLTNPWALIQYAHNMSGAVVTGHS